MTGNISVSELFHENSKQHPSDSRMTDRIIAVSASPIMQSMMASALKTYSNAQKFSFESNGPLNVSIVETVLTRRSQRALSGESVTRNELGQLLRMANGVTGSMSLYGGQKQYFRTTPSAGALYPVELYAFVLNVDDLPAGLYHFDPVENQLESVRFGDFRLQLQRCTHENAVQSAAVMFAMTGTSPKSRLKYGERGYRFMLLEAGHLGQNALLAAHALDLAAFAIGGFLDDDLDRLLDIDGLDEVSLYMIAIGRKEG